MTISWVFTYTCKMQNIANFEAFGSNILLNTQIFYLRVQCQQNRTLWTKTEKREIHTSSFLHPRCKFGKSECYKMENHYHYYYYHYQLLARCSTYISLGGESTFILGIISAKVFGIIFLKQVYEDLHNNEAMLIFFTFNFLLCRYLAFFT